MSKKKIEERTVEVPKGDKSHTEAMEEVKKVSGFSACLFLRGRVVGDKVEYEFLVGNDENALKAELFARRMEVERSLM